MLYFVEMNYLSDGYDENFDAAPVYGVSDGFGFFAEIGRDKVRAWKAYQDMIRAIRRLDTASLLQRVSIAQRYYDMRNDALRPVSDRYALEDIDCALYGYKLKKGLVSLPAIVEKLRNGDLDFLADEE